MTVAAPELLMSRTTSASSAGSVSRNNRRSVTYPASVVDATETEEEHEQGYKSELPIHCGTPSYRRKNRLPAEKVLVRLARDSEKGFNLHQAPAVKDDISKKIIMDAFAADSVCSSLTPQEQDFIFQSFEYCILSAGEEVVKQGDEGCHFFVTHCGVLDVEVDGRHINTMTSGHCFGATALLYDCLRTATVRAREASGLWVASSADFRTVMKKHAEAHYEENKQFLDCVTFFDVLSSAQKESLSDLAIHTEAFEPGQRVVTEGELPTAVYVVKKGTLSVWKGVEMDDNGHISGGRLLGQLKVGDCFGERAALYGLDHRSCTVVADVRCELVCMGLCALKSVLGDDLVTMLERSLVLSILHKMPVVSHLSLTQRRKLAGVMRTRSYAEGEVIGKETQLFIVLDGGVRNDELTLTRGEWFGDSCLFPKDSIMSRRIGDATSAVQTSERMELRAETAKTRLSVLTKNDVVQALRELGLSSISSADQALDCMRKVLMAKKVTLFRELSEEQIDRLVKSFVVRKYSKGMFVMEEGEFGDTFFIVASGELNILVGGECVRSLSRNSCFGERALLFDEPRTASVQAVSEILELWSVTRENFETIVTPSMRQELVRRVQIQDTSVDLRSLVPVRLIGAGSFGSVRLVEHKYTKLRYALKSIKMENGLVPEAVQRECDILRSLDHPFVLRVIRIFLTTTNCYILTELVTGGTLFDMLERTGTVLSRKQAQFYVGSLVLILEALHDQHIVYRDLKPENVMVDSQGYLKLIDFGLAARIRISGRTYTYCGTLYYMAPEIIKGKGYGMAVDVWALGVVMYDMLEGHFPFGDRATKEQAVVEDILRGELEFEHSKVSAQKLIRSMLKTAPEKRIGIGLFGWEDVKQHKYFNTGITNLFDKIISRSLPPPWVPECELYTDEKELPPVKLTDADELGDYDS